MGHCMWGSFVKMLCFIRGVTAWRASAGSRWRFYAMLSALLVAMLPWQVKAETAGAPLPNSAEQATGALRRGIVTTNSRLRTSPSMQSEVVAIAKQGTQVEILMDTDSWLHVRSSDDIEAWIYKRLVHIEGETLQVASAPPSGIEQPDITELLFASAARPNASMESTAENSPELLGSGASSATAIEAAPISAETIIPDWLIDLTLPYLYSPGAYVISALIVALVLSITLQLRGVKQLRRAMQEIGQILAIVEEMYRDAVMTPGNEGGTAMPLTAVEAPTQQNLPPLIQFSPVEQAVLEALSDQCAIQEEDLGKILGEKG
jgi:SH3-like domain-containing protein